MSDPDQAEVVSIRTRNEQSGEDWRDEQFAIDELNADEDFPAVDHAMAFSSLGFIGAAIRRGALIWCVTALAGLAVGLAAYVKFPPAYQATTSVLLMNNPNTDALAQVTTDVTLAQSQAVAQSVVQQLGLHQTAGSFESSITVTAVTQQVVGFTVNAKSGPEALRRATALAAAFLQFRSHMLTDQQALEVSGFNQQIAKAQHRVNALNQQIALLNNTPGTTDAQLATARANRDLASTELTAVENNASAQLAADNAISARMRASSQVLNPAALLPRTAKKGLVFYAAVALLAGLAIGMGFVIVRALVSDRLRRRDEVADAIGAPVRLSVRTMGGGHRPARRTADMRRIVAHLTAAIPAVKEGPASLAVVSVDNTETAARAVVQLARQCISSGRNVVVADLSAGMQAARLLGVKSTGVSAVGPDLTVTVAERGDIAPAGPLVLRAENPDPDPGAAQVSPALAAAYGRADMLLTFATLDPATGGDHLSTWAADAVALVTTGRSSVARVHAVGEMIRLAGIRLVSVILLGADKTDETLGVPTPAG